MNILIGLAASGSDMKIQTAFSLVMATNLLRSLGHELTVDVRCGPYTHWNREGLVESALEAEMDRLMFVDTDVVFPADGMLSLLGLERDIAGGMYSMRSDPPMNTIKMEDAEGKFIQVPPEEIPREPFQCAALPTGFMLIKTESLRKMEPPYFPCDRPVGEDVAFCRNARKQGLEVWCDPRIPIGHLGEKVY